jgi:hypothetical protein
VSIVDEATVEVTGGIDWDLAIFGPKFTSIRTPFRLWNVDGEYSYDEVLAITAPTHSEQWEFKKVFEVTVGG